MARPDGSESAAEVPAPVTEDDGFSVVPVDESREGAHPSATPAGRSWWRRIPVWACVVVALVVGIVVGIVVGLTVSALTSPQPARRLAQVPSEGAPLDFQMYGMRAHSPVRYQSFHDLEVWSARTDQGSTCIVVTTDEGEWMTAGCAPEPLHPTADVTFFSEMRPIDGIDLPPGSVLRFILRGDVLEVWIAESIEDA